jgi:hypothetical protein
MSDPAIRGKLWLRPELRKLTRLMLGVGPRIYRLGYNRICSPTFESGILRRRDGEKPSWAPDCANGVIHGH